jgi:anaerobic nitric oxide reductase transcription regulator
MKLLLRRRHAATPDDVQWLCQSIKCRITDSFRASVVEKTRNVGCLIDTWRRQTYNKAMHEPLLAIATDLCANLAADDRYARIVAAVQRVVPCDAAAVLRLEGDAMVPVAAVGLVPDAMGRRFVRTEHPRLDRILATALPVRFADARLPDPFDGLLVGGGLEDLADVHACMGCALRVDGAIVGALTVDAIDPRAFDAIDDETLLLFAALAGAAMRTAGLIEALERTALRQGRVAAQLVREVQQREGGEILGQSLVARHLRDEVALLASSDLTALITGETGVGKEVVARAIHAQSARRKHPLIYVNCAALPESIAESELFGHVRGAFTGASEARPGKFEVADGGTLLLDEIGELPLSIQPKLLRVLQFGEIQRVGTDRPLRVDVRVLAATNRELAEEVRAGRFRADLFHRLSVYPVHVAPLRERDSDVELLAGYFLDAARVRLGLGPVRLTPSARQQLQQYQWPGNVRELQHVLLRAALRASGGKRHVEVRVDAVHLDLDVGGQAGVPDVAPRVTDAPGQTLRAATEAFERELLQRTLKQTHGNWAEAARRLGVDRGNLHRLGQRLGVRID